MSKTTLNQRIQHFYDKSTRLWLNTWGEHMHHGYYGADGKQKKGRQQAQEDLIEELLRFAEVESAERIFDPGCGVGGSARYLARRFDASVLGVTLSPVQAREAREYSLQAGLEEQVDIEARDMMTVGAADGPFDLVWSLESAEHIKDKAGLLGNFHTMLNAGGKVALATWCHRNIPPELTAKDYALLQKVYDIYNLPPMNSEADLATLAREAGFSQVRTADWSAAVAPFWKEVIRSALHPRNFGMLLRTNWSTIRGAWAMRYMQKGYQQGLIRFVVLTGTKE